MDLSPRPSPSDDRPTLLRAPEDCHAMRIVIALKVMAYKGGAISLSVVY